MEISNLTWIKSRRCESHACVEVAAVDGNMVAVRSSTDPEGAILTFTKDEWVAFIGGAKDGQFDFNLDAA